MGFLGFLGSLDCCKEPTRLSSTGRGDQGMQGDGNPPATGAQQGALSYHRVGLGSLTNIFNEKVCSENIPVLESNHACSCGLAMIMLLSFMNLVKDSRIRNAQGYQEIGRGESFGGFLLNSTGLTAQGSGKLKRILD